MVEVVLSRLAERTKTLDWLANRIELRPSTLRSQLHRGGVPADKWAALCKELWPDEDPVGLARQYGVRYARKKRTAAELASRWGQAAAGDLLRWLSNGQQKLRLLRVTPAVLTYAERLQEGDVFAYTSMDRAPYEAATENHGQFADTRVQAVRAGAVSLYLLPKGDRRLAEELERYRTWVSSRIQRVSGYTPESADAIVDNNLLVLPVKSCPFWCPQFSFGFHQARDQNRVPVQRVSVRLPDDFSSEIIHSDRCETLGSQFYRFLLETLTAHVGSRRHPQKERLRYLQRLVTANHYHAERQTSVPDPAEWQDYSA